MKQLTAVGLAAIFILGAIPLFAQGTAFTYQGRLNDTNGPVTGTYDLQFRVYDSSGSGTLVVGPDTISNVTVTGGLFTTTVDFGQAFYGNSRWLEIAVRTNGGPAFFILSPRQPVLATPQSMYASAAAMADTATTANNATVAGFADSAGTATAADFAETAQFVSGTVYASQLGGTLSPAQLPSSVLTNTQQGVTLSGTFSGNGSGLTNVPASALASNLVTNNQTNVVLSGTFNGNGFGLETLVSSNYLYAYDTTYQDSGSDSSYNDVTFNSNGITNGWTHTPGSSSFVCHQSGIYLVTYTAQVKLITDTVLASMTITATLNNANIPGSQSFAFINTGAGEVPLSRTFVYPINSGDVLKIRYIPFLSALDNLYESPNSPSPSASITVVRIK